MTNEDKKLVTDYMDWSKDYGYVEEYDSFRELDLNDAGLCVQEMQKRGDWFDFYWFAIGNSSSEALTAWLFNADNFFKGFVEWRKK